jgi:hypothetical protein
VPACYKSITELYGFNKLTAVKGVRIMIFKHNGHNKKNTPGSINRKIGLETEARVRYLALKGNNFIDTRLRELDKEWDLERVLQLNAGSFALAGVILAGVLNKRWLFVPGIVTAFLIQQSILGWCPPVPFLRSMGIRTRSEIERERMALKAIRGDFKDTAVEKDRLKRADKAIKAAGER